MSLLEISDLHVSYGRTEAVKGVDLVVEAGTAVCLIGANGAGKSSIMRAVSGLLRPSAGRVRFDGCDITGWRPHRIAAAGLVQVPEGRQIFAELSVAENLTLGGWLVRQPAVAAARRAEVLERFPRLGERAGQLAGSLSGGEQQMLALGRAMMAGPRLLLLDEPSMGLAPIVVEQIFATLADLRRAGTTILIVEQNASAALELADEAYVLETGLITAQGPAPLIARDPAVISAYLGG